MTSEPAAPPPDVLEHLRKIDRHARLLGGPEDSVTKRWSPDDDPEDAQYLLFVLRGLRELHERVQACDDHVPPRYAKGFEQVVLNRSGRVLLEKVWEDPVVSTPQGATRQLGTVEQISQAAQYRGIDVVQVDLDPLVRNVYKVLLARGLRGVTLLSVDPETQDKLSR